MSLGVRQYIIHVNTWGPARPGQGWMEAGQKGRWAKKEGRSQHDVGHRKMYGVAPETRPRRGSSGRRDDVRDGGGEK